MNFEKYVTVPITHLHPFYYNQIWTQLYYHNCGVVWSNTLVTVPESYLVHYNVYLPTESVEQVVDTDLTKPMETLEEEAVKQNYSIYV